MQDEFHTGFTMASRFGATIEQIGHDITEGIDGKDVVADVFKGVRNVGVATWHAINGIIPSIANAGSGQEYDVVRREDGIHGTRNAINKIINTKGVLGKASAILAEATDGPVDDGLNLIGGAKWMIIPK